MSDVLDLTFDLIARPSVTPDDAGCQALIADRLAAAGFHCEHLRLGQVDNLWATHGQGAPVLVLLGHTDVVPPGPVDAWASDPFVPQIRDMAWTWLKKRIAVVSFVDGSGFGGRRTSRGGATIDLDEADFSRRDTDRKRDGQSPWRRLPEE